MHFSSSPPGPKISAIVGRSAFVAPTLARAVRTVDPPFPALRLNGEVPSSPRPWRTSSSSGTYTRSDGPSIRSIGWEVPDFVFRLDRGLPLGVSTRGIELRYHRLL